MLCESAEQPPEGPRVALPELKLGHCGEACVQYLPFGATRPTGSNWRADRGQEFARVIALITLRLRAVEIISGNKRILALMQAAVLGILLALPAFAQETGGTSASTSMHRAGERHRNRGKTLITERLCRWITRITTEVKTALAMAKDLRSGQIHIATTANFIFATSGSWCRSQTSAARCIGTYGRKSGRTCGVGAALPSRNGWILHVPCSPDLPPLHL
jgi:hypothetical protein